VWGGAGNCVICGGGGGGNLVSFPGGERGFFFPQSFRTTFGANYLGGGGIKAAGREAYHSPTSSAEVKNTWR